MEELVCKWMNAWISKLIDGWMDEWRMDTNSHRIAQEKSFKSSGNNNADDTENNNNNNNK